MKRIAALIAALTMIFSLCACSNGRANSSDSSPEQASSFAPTASSSSALSESSPPEVLSAPESSQPSEEDAPNKNAPIASGDGTESAGDEESCILIAYFSWAENAVQDEIDAMTSASVTAPGNVAQLAAWISEQTGGYLFSIQVEEPYPAGWDECLSRANQEKADGVRPLLSTKLENLEDYDTVFLGYPNWWYSCPMAILSFLEEYDLSGKQVYLFCSHGTGGLASSVRDITAVMPEDAVISERVFHLYQDDTPSGRGDLEKWLEEIGY